MHHSCSYYSENAQVFVIKHFMKSHETSMGLFIGHHNTKMNVTETFQSITPSNTFIQSTCTHLRYVVVVVVVESPQAPEDDSQQR